MPVRRQRHAGSLQQEEVGTHNDTGLIHGSYTARHNCAKQYGKVLSWHYMVANNQVSKECDEPVSAKWPYRLTEK